MSHGGSGHGDGGLDFELNLAPIIDCFTVLITFMLVSATYLSLTSLEASVAPQQMAVHEPVNANEPPPPGLGVKLYVELKQNGETQLKLTGEENAISMIPASPNGRDTDAALGAIKEIKSRWPRLEKFTLSADRNVQYRELVVLMEQAKHVVPSVMLGGF